VPNEPVASEVLRAILEGCAGVTAGPWRFPGTRMGGDASVVAEERLIASVHPRRFRAPFEEDNQERDANAAHIARLYPERVAAIITELLELRARNQETTDA
jgi:hypothetical protein